jgi:RHS repeat-associated protein
MLVQTFGVNSLNQLTNATRSGTFTVAGQATGPRAEVSYGLPGVTNVVVSGTGLTTGNADLYADGAWAKTNATLANGNNTYTATAQDTYNRTATDSLTVNVPATTTFQYDGNGNLTNDGRRVFEYDYENQLTNVYVASAWRSEFKYDALGRRRVRKEYTWQSGAWALTNEVRYVYDGMLVVQERDANNLPQVSYTRGNDLSGDLQGAGGIGGLLARTANPQMLDASTQPQAHAYYHADGNGNITALVNTNGIVVARYSYDPYGNFIGMSGVLAEANIYRFSSKEYHANSGIYCYGYRYYEPNLQRWLNRDLIGEMGGINLYQMVDNNSVNEIDAFGQSKYNRAWPTTQQNCPPSQITAQWNHPIPYNNNTYQFHNHDLVKRAGWTQSDLKWKQEVTLYEGHAGPHNSCEKFMNEVKNRLNIANESLDASASPAKCEIALKSVAKSLDESIKNGMPIYNNKTVTPVEGVPTVPYSTACQQSRFLRAGAATNRVIPIVGFIFMLRDMLFYPESFDANEPPGA